MSCERARKIGSTILRAFADRGQRPVAEACEMSESKISRWKSGDLAGGGMHLEEVSCVLAALGLAVIEADANDLVTLSRDEYDALTSLARKALMKVAA